MRSRSLECSCIQAKDYPRAWENAELDKKSLLKNFRYRFHAFCISHFSRQY